MRFSQLSLMFVFAALTAKAQLPAPPQAVSVEPSPPAATPEAGSATALDRVIEAAMKSSLWNLCRTQSDRLAVMREKALVHDSDATPVSDRYLITTLAGPVDLVHFFALARTVSRGTDRYQALHREWDREGGPLHVARQTTAKTDCQPDDLPSNALGALFGEELMQHEMDLDFDMVARLKAFFAKLEPVPDTIAKSHPHETLVRGLTPASTRDEIRASHEWFTAAPLYIIPTVAPDRAAALPDAVAALKAAGLMLRTFNGQLIIIERLGTPERPAKFTRAVPAEPERPRPPSQAVPVE